MEESPEGESQSDEEVEQCVQEVQGLVRTVNCATEARLQKAIPSDSELMPFMIKSLLKP